MQQGRLSDTFPCYGRGQRTCVGVGCVILLTNTRIFAFRCLSFACPANSSMMLLSSFCVLPIRHFHPLHQAISILGYWWRKLVLADIFPRRKPVSFPPCSFFACFLDLMLWRLDTICPSWHPRIPLCLLSVICSSSHSLPRCTIAEEHTNRKSLKHLLASLLLHQSIVRVSAHLPTSK